MKYLKYFEQASAYEAYKNGSEFVLPNVSYVENSDVVYFNPLQYIKNGVILAKFNATEENMLALADTSNVKSLKVNGENIVFDPVQITNKSIEILGKNIVVNEDGTGEYPDEYMHFFSEGTPIKITIKLKDDSLNITDFNCISFLGKYGGEDVKWCNTILIEEAINGGFLSFDEINNTLIVDPQFNGCTAVGFVLGNVDVTQEIRVPIFVDTVNEMEIQTGGMPKMYYFNEVGEYNVEIELIDNTVINGLGYDENENVVSNSMFFDNDYWIGACLTSINIPDSVTTIGYRALCSCKSLASVHIGSGITEIGNETFYGCESLKSVNIGSGVTKIGSQAFRECSNLTSINIPDSVIEIEDYAFDSCSNLTSIVIPDSVTTIGDSAFGNCTSLPVENSLRYAGTYLVGAVDKSLSTYTIKEGTKWIGTKAFYNCSNLTSINIPDSVTTIGKSAFYNCSSLTSIVIPDSITSIGWGAFMGCISLPVKNSVRYAGTYLVGAVNKSLSTYTIKEGTKWIGTEAFYNCSNLTSINIPDSVIEIGYQAFYVCKKLTSITIPDSVTSIGSEAFYQCTKLTSINIPDSVTSIGYSAFGYCSGLTSVHIGSSVTTIETGTFNSCTNLNEITCLATTAPNITYGTFDSIKQNGILKVPVGSDYSSWMITDPVYLGYYNWSVEYI